MKLEDIKIGGKYKPLPQHKHKCGLFVVQEAEYILVTAIGHRTHFGGHKAILYDVVTKTGRRRCSCWCYYPEHLEPYEETPKSLAPQYHVGQKLYDKGGDEYTITRCMISYNVASASNKTHVYSYLEGLMERLFTTEPIKQMTHAEVEEKLGYKIKIV